MTAHSRLTQHQRRLLQRMVFLLDDYLTHGLHFSRVVGELEGALDASELGESGFIEAWYGLWGPLETRRAVHGDSTARDDARADVEALRAFVVRYLSQTDPEGSTSGHEPTS